MKYIKLFLISLFSISLVGCVENINTVENAVESSVIVEETIESSVDNMSESVFSETLESKSGSSSNNIYTFTGEPFIEINNNIPEFDDFDKSVVESFEIYSDLDSLGRCGVAYACIGQDLMPTDNRGDIGSVKPSGWKSVKYDNISGKYLYNRCHLIGYQLTAENANEKNLITGTRYLNIDGMLPFENMVTDYIKETGNHVLYRVTPIFDNNNLVASGVQMEGLSVEDNGAGICYNVYCFNVQPGIKIDYLTGDSCLSDEEIANNSVEEKETESNTIKYVLNTNTKKFHREECSESKRIRSENKEISTLDRNVLIDDGYRPCGKCKP